MLSDIMSTLQGMNNTALIVLFVCAGVAYFKFIRPELIDAKALRAAQFQKIEHIPTGDGIQKMLDDTVSGFDASVAKTVTAMGALETQIIYMNKNIEALQTELNKHIQDTTDDTEDRNVRIGQIINNTTGIDAIIDHLLMELAKSGHIAPIDTERLKDLKHRATTGKSDLDKMVELITQQLTTGKPRASKLNRIINTRG